MTDYHSAAERPRSEWDLMMEAGAGIDGTGRARRSAEAFAAAAATMASQGDQDDRELLRRLCTAVRDYEAKRSEGWQSGECHMLLAFFARLVEAHRACAAHWPDIDPLAIAIAGAAPATH